MKRTKVNHFISFSLLLAIAFSFVQCSQSDPEILYNKKYIDEIKAAREKIMFFMSGNFITGGSFAIAKDGEIIYSEGVGLASKDLDVPVNRQTKFRIAQLSELFTSLIYHKMVEEGTLHPDSSVQYYLPDFPEKEYSISLHHLINQVSGIRTPTQKEKEWRAFNVSIQKGIDVFKDDPLTFPPGMYQAASFFNYNLLGAIMEKETGNPMSDILENYVTDTLDLENTVIDNPFITIKGRTSFFDQNYIAQQINATTIDLRFRAPSDGILSNAEDLVKFGNALLYSDYFSEEIKQKLFEPVILMDQRPAQLSNGWMLLRDRAGRTIYGRSGSVNGGSAAILVYPEEKMVFASAINRGGTTNDHPVFDMAAAFFPKEEGEKD